MLFDDKELSEIAIVAKSYGLNGHLSLKLIDGFSDEIFDENIPVFLLIDGIPVPFFVENFKNSGGYIAVKFKYIDNSETANKYKNCKVLIFSKDIPCEDTEFEEFELLGYKVYDVKFGCIGKIVDFNFIPGNPVFETELDGKNIIIPYSEDFIIDINDSKQEVYIKAPEGLIDLYLEK